MQNALALWQRLGLPELAIKEPWYGYDLGDWSADDETPARRALVGDAYLTGEEFMRQRRGTR